MHALRMPLVLTMIGTTLAWATWGVIIVRAVPDALGGVGWAVFYVTLFFACAGTAMVLGLAARRRNPDRSAAVRIAVRQGVLAGLGITIALALQSRRILSWLNMSLLVGMLTLLELFWISIAENHTGHRSHDSVIT